MAEGPHNRPKRGGSTAPHLHGREDHSEGFVGRESQLRKSESRADTNDRGWSWTYFPGTRLVEAPEVELVNTQPHLEQGS